MTKLADMWADFHSGPLPKFQPAAKYIAPMDCLLYLREDCSYRAVRLNAYTTVLLHPYEDRPVGVKLKGVRFLHERLTAILRSLDLESPLNKLITFWEIACTESGDTVTENAEGERQRQLAARARKIVEGAADISKEELELALAA